MNKKVKKETSTTYDQYVQGLTASQRKKFDAGYQDFLLSELLIALMKEDALSVHALAKAAGISPTIVQGVRSGTQKNITMTTFLKIVKKLGCSIIIEKEGSRFPLDVSSTSK